MITFCPPQPKSDPNHRVIPVDQKPPLKPGMVVVTKYGNAYLSIKPVMVDNVRTDCLYLSTLTLHYHGESNNGWGHWSDENLINGVKIFESLDEYFQWKFSNK